MARGTPGAPPPAAQAPDLLRPRYRGYVLVMLTIGLGLSHLDRQIVNILLPAIKAELRVSDSQLGLMSGLAFAVFYAGFGIPLARLADRWSRRNLMGISIVAWSVMTTAAGLAVTFPQLVISRFGVGIGEAGYAPAAFSMVSDYFSRAKRQTAAAVMNLGPQIGTVLGLVIGGLVAPIWGWRAAFLVAGVPGVIFGLVLLLTVREPPRGLADGVTREPEPTLPLASSAAKLWSRASYRWLVMLATIFSFTHFAVASWMPSLLIRVHHMKLEHVGLALGLAIVGLSPIGTLLGGVLGDRLGKRDARLSLVLPAVGGVLAPPLMTAAVFVGDATAAIVLYGLALMVASLHMAPAHALIQSASPLRLRGLAWSVLVVTTALIGGGLGPVLVGVISDALTPQHGDDALRYAMAWSALGYLAAAACAWPAAKTLRRDLAAAEAENA